jgi:chemotaxis response regulator CheB
MPKSEFQKYPEVALINPSMSTTKEIATKIWEANIANKPKAIVYKSFGSGTVAPNDVDEIRKAVREKGIPVFLLSSMERDGGIRKVTYEAHDRARKAGAVNLERVNYGDVKREWLGETKSPENDVIRVINEIAQEKTDMFDLIDEVRQRYQYTDEELKDFSDREHVLDSRKKLDETLAEIRREREAREGSEHKGITRH